MVQSAPPSDSSSSVTGSMISTVSCRLMTRIVARWNGQPLLETTDPNPAAGRAGVATAGPGVAGFDEFVVDPSGK